MNLGRRIAMDLTVAQERHMRRAAGTARLAWNQALAEHRALSAAARAESDEAKRKAMWPTTARLRASWTERRKTDLPWTSAFTKCAGAQAVIDLGGAFERFFEERRDAKREGRETRRSFGAPRFKSRRRTTSAFALWNDQFSVADHYRFDARPRATMRVPLLGEVRLREAVPGIGGILGCRVSLRRGR
ncbi:helix-turn-helix domain-containing protein [Lichenibacterium dinghuense]|uniref:helix-turn-helix domain-containing protein n=1 Tax=Lichenibacterium dinghuense TaxID=2895977 RepID=UPI002107F19E|nr:helix-turn-helix domain-containing protein [Lichenibacterium sp. 6Y81]